VYGQLQICGNGQLKEYVQVGSAESLRQDCKESNQALLASMKEDEFAAELHKLTMEDAKLGRMTFPVPANECCLSETKLQPGFGVEQGLKTNGQKKIRAVDNMSWGLCEGRRTKKRMREFSVNGHSAIPEQVKHDHIDCLAASMSRMVLLMGVTPGIFKADIAAAFRRIPIMPEHMWAAGVAYIFDGVVYVSWHKACMFGATSSVYNWDRIGALLTCIIIRVLNICLFRYVDDLFACERPASMQHAMLCVARLVRLLLGPEAIDNKKLHFGTSLDVLGMSCMLDRNGLCLRPAADKKKKCLETVLGALESGVLHAGCAQKLAGRLSWAQTFTSWVGQ